MREAGKSDLPSIVNERAASTPCDNRPAKALRWGEREDCQMNCGKIPNDWWNEWGSRNDWWE